MCLPGPKGDEALRGLVSCGSRRNLLHLANGGLTYFSVGSVPLVAFAGAGIYKLIQQSNEDAEYRQREATSRNLIQPSQLVLNNVQLGQSYGLWKVNGTVQNNSQHPLSHFWLHVTVQDCPASCVTIDEDDVGIDVKVPPGQLRSFDRNIYLANLPTAQRMKWVYRVDSVKAEVP
jgi:hypothetical protein